ncbi:MAG: hypothetical protein QNJ62_14130 [Methyloceanibacter sp.]|nr:hypothetical protein [Methyloceanibacter sp.]
MRFQLFGSVLMFAFLGVLVLNTGCAKTPMASMMHLAKVDFQTTDLSAVRAAILLPQGLRPLPETERLTVAVRRPDGSTEDHVFALQAVDDPEVALLNEEHHGREWFFAYKLNAKSVRTLERLRKEVATKRKTGSTGASLTLGISSEACYLATEPSGPLPISTYLKTEETKSFVPLVRKVDLRSITGHARLDLVPCQSGSSA